MYRHEWEYSLWILTTWSWCICHIPRDTCPYQAQRASTSQLLIHCCRYQLAQALILTQRWTYHRHYWASRLVTQAEWPASGHTTASPQVNSLVIRCCISAGHVRDTDLKCDKKIRFPRSMNQISWSSIPRWLFVVVGALYHDENQLSGCSLSHHPITPPVPPHILEMDVCCIFSKLTTLIPLCSVQFNSFPSLQISIANVLVMELASSRQVVAVASIVAKLALAISSLLALLQPPKSPASPKNRWCAAPPSHAIRGPTCFSHAASTALEFGMSLLFFCEGKIVFRHLFFYCFYLLIYFFHPSSFILWHSFLSKVNIDFTSAIQAAGSIVCWS